MRYRYSLGKTMGAANQVTDGVFNTVCGAGNWVCGANWAIAAGQAATTAPAGGFLYQSGVFTPGSEYTIKFDVNFVNPAASLGVWIGDLRIDELLFTENTLGPGVHTIQIDNLINLTTSTRLVFNGLGQNIILDNVEVFEWTYNTPQSVEPGQWDESSKILKESSINASLIVSFLSNLKFIKTSYVYLLGVYNTDGIGTRLPIKVENWDSVNKVWEEFFEGQIIIAEMQIDYEKLTIAAEVEGTELESVLQQDWNSKIRVSSNNVLGRLIDAVPSVVVAFDNVNLHNTASGANVGLRVVGSQIRMILEIIVQASRMRLTIASTYLGSALYNDGVPIFLGATKGTNIRNAVPIDVLALISPNDFFNNYGFVTNLVFTYARDVNNIPTLNIEDKASLINTVPSITLNNVKLEPVSLAIESEYKIINTGFTTVDGLDEDFQFYSLEKGLQEELNVKCEWVRNSAIVQDLLVTANTQYDQDIVFIEYWNDAGTFRSRQTALGGVFEYNQQILGTNYIDVWTQFLGTVYRNADDAEDVSTPQVDPLWRVFEFDYPMTKANFETIEANPFEYIAFNGFGVDTKGLVKRLEYPLKNAENGSATMRIKILAE